MAPRSYLYGLSSRPASYADRPDEISGLAEWPCGVPFAFRVLMSGDPQLCSSLVSNGWEDEDGTVESSVFAISAEFVPGRERLKKFASAVREVARDHTPELAACVDDTLACLQAHPARYVLLETIELDLATAAGPRGLRASVERRISLIREAGAAVDALSADVGRAAAELVRAVARPPGKSWWRRWAKRSPLDALFGLVLGPGFDEISEGRLQSSLGLSGWGGVLHCQLLNRSQFEAQDADAVDPR